MSNSAIVYARVSTKHQAEEGASLPTQVEECERYAADSGLNVLKVIQDAGFSGGKMIRPGLDEARDMIANGQATDFIVYSSDRFTRKLHHGAILRQEFKKAGATIHYVTKGGASDGTPQSKLFQNIEDSFSEYERDVLQERTRRAKRQKAKGGMIGQTIPKYGFRNCPTKEHKSGMRIYDPEAKIVRRIFDLYTGKNGRPMSLNVIAKTLTNGGIPTPGAGGDGLKGRGKGGGKAWARTGIRKQIIKRREYVGEFSYMGFEFNYPDLAIVDRATFEAAQRQIEKNKHMAKNAGPGAVYPLSGRLTCKCGHAMNGTSTRNRHGSIYYYYRCDYKSRGGAGCCDSKMLRADMVEDLAWQWLIGLFMDQDRLDSELEAMAARSNADLKPIKTEMAAAQSSLDKSITKINKWLDVFGQEDDPDIAAMAAKRVKDEKKIKQALEQHIAGLEAKISAAAMTPELKENIKAGIALLIADKKLKEATAADKKRFMEATAVKMWLEEKGGDRLIHITMGTGEVEEVFALNGTACRNNPWRTRPRA